MAEKPCIGNSKKTSRHWDKDIYHVTKLIQEVNLHEQKKTHIIVTVPEKTVHYGPMVRLKDYHHHFHKLTGFKSPCEIEKIPANLDQNSTLSLRERTLCI
jgi:hypothetical protein